MHARSCSPGCAFHTLERKHTHVLHYCHKHVCMHAHAHTRKCKRTRLLCFMAAQPCHVHNIARARAHSHAHKNLRPRMSAHLNAPRGWGGPPTIACTMPIATAGRAVRQPHRAARAGSPRARQVHREVGLLRQVTPWHCACEAVLPGRAHAAGARPGRKG